MSSVSNMKPMLQPPGSSCPGSEDEGGSSSVSRTPSNASSVSWTPQSSTTTTLPARRKVQKVQLLHLTEPYRCVAQQYQFVGSFNIDNVTIINYSIFGEGTY